jgi:hypothetical protein
MPDWRAYVRERLGALPVSAAEREEIAGELAEHLEDFCAALRARGMNGEQAAQETCAQTGNWEELRRGIASARREGSMSDRVKQIWLPGLVTLLSSYVVLALLQWAGIQPFFFRPAPGRIVFFYTPWLVMLLFIGAAGGFLSRRAKGSGWRVYLATSLPALLMAGLFTIGFFLSFVIDPRVSVELKLATVVTLTLSWVILPGCALMAGAAFQALLVNAWRNSLVRNGH